MQADILEILKNARAKCEGLSSWTSQDISKAMKEIGKDMQWKQDIVMRILRWAITGVTSGIGVPTVMEIIGRDKVKERLLRCEQYVESGKAWA